MTEDVLQYIWQTQSITKSSLLTIDGDAIQILKQGILNSDSGPDFSAAHIVINKVEWVGDVEIHIKTSFWDLHKHQRDPAYNKVILHVVWEHDVEVFRKSNTAIQTLELKNYISKEVLLNYNQLFDENKKWINFVNGGFFKDSNSNTSKYLGGGTKRRFLLTDNIDGWHVDAGLTAFLMTRKDYKNNQPFFGALPFVSVGTDKFAINATYIPSVSPKFVGLFFIQASFTISEW